MGREKDKRQKEEKNEVRKTGGISNRKRRRVKKVGVEERKRTLSYPHRPSKIKHNI